MIKRKYLYSHSISIVIPAFNEQENIELIIKDTNKKLSHYFKDYEIIVVDDGSIDNTGQILDKLAKRNPKLHVIHQKNGGYSRAMLTGIKKATKEFIAYLPADGQFMVDDMRYCFEYLNRADLILGYRGGRPDYTVRRMFMSYGYLMLLVLLFNIKYMDVGWVNIWKTSKVQKMQLKDTGGIFILTEIVVKFMRKKYRIIEAPSFYHPRLGGEVKNAKFSVAFKTFISALHLKLQTLSE